MFYSAAVNGTFILAAGRCDVTLARRAALLRSGVLKYLVSEIFGDAGRSIQEYS